MVYGDFIEYFNNKISCLIKQHCFTPVNNFKEHLNNTIRTFINDFEMVEPPNISQLYAAEALIHLFFNISKIKDINI